ncbi:ABC transporter permease [Marinifilum caeruleilacunae]|uniref:FtsX-like permease family protein n=1 Tax=Marinifilum caeruleilacunae TaxID=2499076 RepID=A0ABX1WTJ7_9BACT|nr:ABC transporter permease [Marinifilum caeruleilacunae]NOU59402.1 FtsX-like permease family protein [Marinifilum caeruleilacunae]
MIINNLKIAYRNLIRNKGFSLINISGLAIGMACTILLLLWVNHEMSYNKFHKDPEQVFQVANYQTWNGRKNAMPNLPGPLIDVLKEKYPEVEYATHFNPWGEKLLLEYNGVRQYANIQCADPDFFQIFNFPLIQGNKETCLNDIGSIVLTEKSANKIFGKENPIGKVVKIDNRQPLTVTAVVENPPTNSTIQFEYLVTFEMMKRYNKWLDSWGSHNFFGYAKIAKGTDISNLNERLDQFYTEHVEEESKKSVFVFPLLKRHLYSLEYKPSKITKVRMYFLIAIFILIIACFNFMNLSTARAAKRAKEIGMKKTIGATYPQLIRQFLGESLLITLIAANFAIILAHFFLPQFNTLMSRQLEINYASGEFWLVILLVTAFTGLIAGAYPAFYLSSFNPIMVLKGTHTGGKGSSKFRRTLTVLQFILASSLLICTLTIVLQTKFLSNMDIGMNVNNVVMVNVNQEMHKKIETIKSELQSNAIVESVSFGSHIPYQVFNNGWGWEWEGKDPNYTPLVTYPSVDADFLDVFQIEMAEGRFFNKENPAADSMCVVVNEKFAKIMSDESVVDNTMRSGDMDYRIIGVVKDYNCTPNNRKLQPVLMQMTQNINCLFVRYTAGNSMKTVSKLEEVCSKYNPDFPVVHLFLNDHYSQLFDSERMTIRTLLYASLLAIIVSCLGLFGLASFNAEERTKEIGVRKVLGASMGQLIMIFGKDFSKWILISTIISWPITYYAMEKWFEDYPYRIDFPFWLFGAVLFILLVVSLITIGYQSWKTATKNPVISLKYE